MRTVSSNNTTVLPLGKQGDNLAEKIIFTDPISWLKGYGPGTVQLLNQRGSSSASFCGVDSSSVAEYYNADNTPGVAFCFCF